MFAVRLIKAYEYLNREPRGVYAFQTNVAKKNVLHPLNIV
jgi:hypothetical protein